ncbi:uncharacterized protein [Drosophila takahashii]|uniref:uncharacterized protein isoform X1 n=1 Tax=Drosophila takahashii TaxID=29030 RepID=UPI001CF8537E|nr:uncharacterized protein LOC108066749 [Drosophila takahashii]
MPRALSLDDELCTPTPTHIIIHNSSDCHCLCPPDINGAGEEGSRREDEDRKSWKGSCMPHFSVSAIISSWILRLHSFLKDEGPRGMLMQVCRIQGYFPLSAGHRQHPPNQSQCSCSGSISPSSSRHALMAQDSKKMKAYVAV